MIQKWHLLTNFLLTKIYEQRVNENFIKWSICWLISLKCVLRISFTILNFVTFSYINWNTSMLYDHYIIDWKFHEIYIINFYFCFEKTISIEYYGKIAIIIFRHKFDKFLDIIWYNRNIYIKLFLLTFLLFL